MLNLLYGMLFSFLSFVRGKMLIFPGFRKLRQVVLIVFLLCVVQTTQIPISANNSLPFIQQTDQTVDSDQPWKIYLPVVTTGLHHDASTPQLNVPHFSGNIDYNQTGIFWFGQVNTSQNYADVRVGYNNEKLWVNVASFDRRLWYKQNPTKSEIPAWDGATLYFNLVGNNGLIGDKAFRFDSMMNWWEPRSSGEYQASYRGNESGWASASIDYTTISGWRGYPAPNDDKDDRGWFIEYEIPFSSLGLSSPPVRGTKWAMAVSLHDRDGESEPVNPVQVWPKRMNTLHPATWGLIQFGLPSYQPPSNVAPTGQLNLRNGVNSVYVPDGMVGGNSMCGEGLDLWTVWGQKNYNGAEQANVQNESDISDWPCFSKYYLTFPLGSVPTGKVILSATLTLYSSGDATGFPDDPHPSTLVEISIVNESWSEREINWNNAPYATENVSRKWVDHVQTPGVPQRWDVSYVLQKAYTRGTPLQLALYTPSSKYGSGRYFYTSDAGTNLRPLLNIVWGNP
jgi:hypothetical protein